MARRNTGLVDRHFLARGERASRVASLADETRAEEGGTPRTHGPSPPHGQADGTRQVNLSAPAPSKAKRRRISDRMSRLFACLPGALPWSKDAVAALLMGGAYYLGAELAFWVGTLSHAFAPLWPPNVILFYALLQAPYRAWPIYVGAALPAHIAAEMQMGMPAEEWLGAFVCNGALALGAASGLRLTVRPPWLGTLTTTWIFILIAALAAPAAVAVAIAIFAFLTDNRIGTLSFAERWFLANLLNGLTLAPMLVSWFGGGFGWVRASRRRWAEAVLVSAGLVISAYVAFATSTSWHFPAYLCVFIPLVLWASVRFGTQGASGAIFVVTLMAIGGAIQGRGPFIGGTPDHIVLSLQMFLAVMSTPFIILAAAIEERRQASAKVSLAERQLQSILDNTPSAIYARDLEGRYILANRRACALANLPADFLGKTAHEVLPEDLATELTSDDRLAIESDRPIIKEVLMPFEGGSRVLLSTKFALRDAEGRTYGACGIATDITEHKRSMAALDASEARFRIMAETVPAILFTADRSGRWDYASQRFFDFTGLSPEAANTPLWSALVHPHDWARVTAAWHRSATLGEPFEQDMRLRSAGGSYYWFVVRGRPMRDAQGRIERWFGAALEIDQLKQTERQLQIANESLNGILASISDFYYTLDNELRLTAINPQAATFAGIDPTQALGRCILDTFPALRGSKLEAAYRTALEKRASVRLECAAVVHPERWLDIDIYPFDAGLSVFSRDVTERKRAEHDLRELSGRLLRAQDEERRRIARELHDGTAQNMVAIALNLQRLCERQGNSADKTQELARSSLGLIDQCLSEIRTLSYLLHPPLLDEVGLAAALHWYADGFEKRSGIAVDIQISPELARLPADTEIALFRVVQESLANVYRHAQSRTAAIRLGQTRSDIILTVADEGRGMPDAAGISSGDDIHSLGVGIGGMQVRLRQLGGRLEVASSKRGTTIRAVVPRPERLRTRCGDAAPEQPPSLR